MRAFQVLLTLSPLSALAAPSHRHEQGTSVIYEAKGTWLENLALTCSSNILTTVFMPYAGVLQVNPYDTHAPALVVANLTAQPGSKATGATGITSLDENQDIFYVSTNALDLTNQIAGDSQVWKLDLTERHPKISLVANITGGMVLNGMTAIAQTGTILIADSFAGVVWRVDAESKAVDVAINDTTIAPPAHGQLGVNGIHVDGPYLYFTNSGTGVYGRYPIHASGSPSGLVEVLYSGKNDSLDDFALDPFASPRAAALAQAAKGQIGLVLGEGDDTSKSLGAVEGPTAVVLGKNGKELFVTSAGNQSAYPASRDTTFGRITRIDI